MLERFLHYILLRFGFKTAVKRAIEDSDEEDDMNERCSKQRKIQKTDNKPYITSSEFLCPAPNWRMPKKRPASSCRQQQRSVVSLSDGQSVVHQSSLQAGCSWFHESKENIINVSDDEDPEVLGEWQDANTLRKCPVYKGGRRSETTASSQPKTDEDDDIEVVKVVDSPCEKISRSGNRLPVFQTPSARGSHSRPLQADSASSRKTPVLFLRLKSSEYSQGSNGSQSSASVRSSQAEKQQRSTLALNESYRLEEKKQYSELLQRFTSVPLHGRGRLPEMMWSPSIKTPLNRDEGTLSGTLAAKARDRLSKESPIMVDLTKPVPKPTHSLRKRIEVRKDREVQPYTLTTKQDDESNDLQVETPFVSKNSLAQALKSNYFCGDDLVASINEKYKRKREARERQEEEEKLKASHFQERDKKLQVEALERMTNYLKLTDAILEDEVIVVEEEVQLPELTPEMQNVIDAALIPKPSAEVLVEAFGLPIKRHDMQTLAGLNWLNDEVINFYMELLKERGKLENYPSVYTFNTFFYPRLLSGGHAALKRWTRKVDIFSFNVIIVPVHLGVHWCMAAIDFRNKTIKYYDSMGSPNNKCLQSLLKYLQDESLDKLKKKFDTTDWTTENVQKIPQQMNGSDCGMFSCMYAEYICRDADITFTQQDMPYFRRKMVYEIFTRKLLL
ncbi:sentrin-specific protease 1-like isoform X2 [Periplaneta americana]|uniref:sentrin-specific protease 1-like isoform X2 n=1 Tax=Periplaneta americana TaxID=6978 RepID=UPI0037E7F158